MILVLKISLIKFLTLVIETIFSKSDNLEIIFIIFSSKRANLFLDHKSKNCPQT